MADRISPAKRSWNMSCVRSADTSPELVVRSALHRMGFRFRLHIKDLPGRPDITLPKYRTAIFVHGCFWHRHKNCPKASMPKTHAPFWEEKFKSNMRRDQRARRALRNAGWQVLTIWECEVKRKKEILQSHLRKAIETRSNLRGA
jgi:DNA mismatch endonuclease (patch repair protein)